jgi:hypothetical protein
MKEEIIAKLEFLKSEEFLLVEERTSEYFGDFLLKFSNGNIDIMVVSDRSMLSIDICSSSKTNEKYDLLIVRSLIIGISEYELSIEEQVLFLKEYLVDINTIFSKSMYKLSSQKLKEIGVKRAKAMFSGWLGRNV